MEHWLLIQAAGELSGHVLMTQVLPGVLKDAEGP